MDHLKRDFIGYGATPPDPAWPGGARLAVNFVLNYEEGAEASITDGDGRGEAGLTESPALEAGPDGRDLAAESMFEYGSRVGFWRLLRLFQERGLTATVFACAQALERNPPAARAIRAAGFDICCHGWKWVNHFELTEAEERDHIQRAIASLTTTTGSPPIGWYCRHGPSVNTRRLLVETGGFLYDSDAYNDDLPYWTRVAGRDHLVVPYSLVNNDSKFSRGWFGHGEDYFQFMRDGFDFLHAEGARSPRMMSCGLHLRLIGHPARAMGLQRFLDHVAGTPEVWVTGRADIARHWAATHPPGGKTA